MPQSPDIRDLVQRWMAWKSRADGAEYQYRMLAADAGVSPSYLSNIMTGARNAGVKTISGIAQAFGIDLADFYAGPPENADQGKDIGVHIAESTEKPDNAGRQDKYGLALSREPEQEIDKLFSSLGYSASDLFADIPDRPSHEDVSDARISWDAPISFEKKVANAAVSIPRIPILEQMPSDGHATWISGRLDALESLPGDFGLAGRSVFAVRMPNASMSPDLKKGDILIADIDAPFEPGGGAVGIVTLDGRFMPRKIVARRDDYLAVPANPAFLSNVVSRNERIFKVVLWLPDMNGKF